MSEPASEATPTTEPEKQPEPAPKTFSQEDVNAMLAKQKREQFGDYGDLKQKASQFDEWQEQQKTEQQRHADAAAAAKREAEEARAEALRYRAAATHGVGADYFDLLGTGTEEEINARAERVGGFLKTAAENQQLIAEVEALRQGKPAPLSARPKEALKPGASAERIEPSEDDSYPSHWLPQRQQDS